MRRQHSRLRFETLESRTPLAADLGVAEVQLFDSPAEPIVATEPQIVASTTPTAPAAEIPVTTPSPLVPAVDESVAPLEDADALPPDSDFLSAETGPASDASDEVLEAGLGIDDVLFDTSRFVVTDSPLTSIADIDAIDDVFRQPVFDAQLNEPTEEAAPLEPESVDAIEDDQITLVSL